ncbi:hypothetical protein C8Q75DRAFT_254788 [Abortiporus biennis]|nr:hypothetical protein C8Q75DRAFT_254788 [Abortiporus biennis]
MEGVPSTSIETIRGVPLHLNISKLQETESSCPSSPHSSLPSPSSPSGDSVSSFPSVSSSFLFSSVPASPPHNPASGSSAAIEGDSNELIIPSLTLPTPVRRPTPYGQSLGDVKLIVLSRTGSDVNFALSVFSDDNCEDFVQVDHWEELPLQETLVHSNIKGKARVLKVSTDWVECRDMHGLDKRTPTKNLEILHLGEYDHECPENIVHSVLSVVHHPFQTILPLLNEDQPPNPLLASLLTSTSSPLYTALVFVLPSAPTKLDQLLISELSTHIPIILFPPLPHPTNSSYGANELLVGAHATSLPSHTPTPPSAQIGLRISAIRPEDPHSFRTSLLRSPEIISTLRVEAVDRFLRWREVERGVAKVLGGNTGNSASPTYMTPSPLSNTSGSNILGDSLSNISRVHRGKEKTEAEVDPLSSSNSTGKWDKARWEVEWEGTLSSEVSRTVRQRKGTLEGGKPRPADRRRATITTKNVQSRNQPPIPNVHSRRSHEQSKQARGSSRTNKDLYRASSVSSDPLHFPSIFAFSLSLLDTLREKIFGSSYSWSFVLGAFCAGIGLGLYIARN